jgi:hypothetical protein
MAKAKSTKGESVEQGWLTREWGIQRVNSIARRRGRGGEVIHKKGAQNWGGRIGEFVSNVSKG